MRIILDTNVIVSAILSPAGNPARILTAVLSSKIELLYNNHILAEYITVLRQEKFRLNKELNDYIIEYICKEGVFFFASLLKIKFDHEDDKKFYELYKSGKADYLVTGNIKHFPKENGIVTPKTFIQKIQIE